MICALHSSSLQPFQSLSAHSVGCVCLCGGAIMWRFENGFSSLILARFMFNLLRFQNINKRANRHNDAVAEHSVQSTLRRNREIQQKREIRKLSQLRQVAAITNNCTQHIYFCTNFFSPLFFFYFHFGFAAVACLARFATIYSSLFLHSFTLILRHDCLTRVEKPPPPPRPPSPVQQFHFRL